jgi:hypothetical protein
MSCFGASYFEQLRNICSLRPVFVRLSYEYMWTKVSSCTHVVGWVSWLSAACGPQRGRRILRGESQKYLQDSSARWSFASGALNPANKSPSAQTSKRMPRPIALYLHVVHVVHVSKVIIGKPCMRRRTALPSDEYVLRINIFAPYVCIVCTS